MLSQELNLIHHASIHPVNFFCTCGCLPYWDLDFEPSESGQGSPWAGITVGSGKWILYPSYVNFLSPRALYIRHIHGLEPSQRDGIYQLYTIPTTGCENQEKSLTKSATSQERLKHFERRPQKPRQSTDLDEGCWYPVRLRLMTGNLRIQVEKIVDVLLLYLLSKLRMGFHMGLALASVNTFNKQIPEKVGTDYWSLIIPFPTPHYWQHQVLLDHLNMGSIAARE